MPKIDSSAVLIAQVAVPGGKSAFEARMSRLATMASSYLRRSIELVYVVMDDPTIHEINRTNLEHDYPTDVLAFEMGEREGVIHGEILLSADTARRESGERGHSAADELCLYAVHGTLHLVGYDDHEPAQRRRMRAAERRWLGRLGCRASYGR